MSDRGTSGRISRRLLLGALLGSVAGHAFANAPLTSMRPVARGAAPLPAPVRPVDALITEAKLSGAVGFALADAETGEMLEIYKPFLALPPASVTKAITALYALDRLGPEYRFKTQLVATGPVLNGRLDGDLVLVGGGDPTLDTDALGELAAALKATGLREVTGDFLVFSSSLPTILAIDPDQPDHMSYNPAVSGLNLNYNRVHFEWKRAGGGYDVSMDARARKYSPSVAIARMQVVDRGMPVYTYSDAGGADSWTVAKGALGQAGSRWLPVRKPELYAAEVFQTLARSHGIVLKRSKVASTAPVGTVLAEQNSAVLRDVLRDMLKWSTNLTAEVAGLTASQVDADGTQSLQESAGAMSEWAQAELGARQARFVDHSGLGDQSRIRAVDMVVALVKAREKGLGSIMKTIPMRDSQWKVVANHPVKVRAKTGTLNFVSALAGYLTAADGREMAFAMFTADMDAREGIKPDEEDAPPGSKAWLARSRRLQMKLLQRWGSAHSG